MKALITAFALLSFVAASTVPMMARAADATTEQPAPAAKADKKMPAKHATKHSTKKSASKASKKTHHAKKTAKKPAAAG